MPNGVVFSISFFNCNSVDISYFIFICSKRANWSQLSLCLFLTFFLLIQLPVIGEDGCVSPSERIINNDVSVERSVVVDAVTGERTVTLVEKSITKREASLCSSSRELQTLNL